MADAFSNSKRSEVMSLIRSRGNKDTELALARLLRANGITGWRRHVQVRISECGMRSKTGERAAGNSFRTPHSELRVLTVRPDFVFRRMRTVILVDGCFWHGCPKHCNPMKWLKKSSMSENNPPSPKRGLWRTGRAFWRRKLAANQKRDAVVNRTLRQAGWRVIRIWEHELARSGERRLIPRILDALDK